MLLLNAAGQLLEAAGAFHDCGCWQNAAEPEGHSCGCLMNASPGCCSEGCRGSRAEACAAEHQGLGACHAQLDGVDSPVDAPEQS